ncbi:MAG TPA: NAD(P)/FAD-dependent oxidoreductase [Gammaproteobacteria bacterium]
MSRAERHEVVVVGAGLAGLSAALALKRAGLDARVLEAQARVGGRVHSMRQLASTAEAGGTYIGAGYTRLIAAAERHGVELIDVTPICKFFREQELVLGRQIIRQSEWPSHPANPFPEPDRALMPWMHHRVLTARENPLAKPADWLDPKQAIHDISLRDWMRGLGCADELIDMSYGINVGYGENAADVSALLMLFRAAFSTAQRAEAAGDVIGYTARDGVQRIPEAMAEALAPGVLLDKVVVAIESGDDAALVRCADGSRYAARAVVCALPFPVLGNIAIDPPLSGAQARAVQTLPYQAMTQVYLTHTAEFWNDDGYAPSLYTDGVAGMLAAARNGEDPDEVTSFTAWTMGPNARRLDVLPEKDAGRLVIEAIEAIRPAARGRLELAGIKSWGSDPFALGGWAYFRPGQVTELAAEMGRAHGRLHFCGEHLSEAARGMEAAMESGERAAAEISSA